jgi:hypothetical protein
MERFLNTNTLYGGIKKDITNKNTRESDNNNNNNYIDDNIKKLFKKNRELQVSLDKINNLYENEKQINYELRIQNEKLRKRCLQFKDN